MPQQQSARGKHRGDHETKKNKAVGLACDGGTPCLGKLLGRSTCGGCSVHCGVGRPRFTGVQHMPRPKHCMFGPGTTNASCRKHCQHAQAQHLMRNHVEPLDKRPSSVNFLAHPHCPERWPLWMDAVRRQLSQAHNGHSIQTRRRHTLRYDVTIGACSASLSAHGSPVMGCCDHLVGPVLVDKPTRFNQFAENELRSLPVPCILGTTQPNGTSPVRGRSPLIATVTPPCRHNQWLELPSVLVTATTALQLRHAYWQREQPCTSRYPVSRLTEAYCAGTPCMAPRGQLCKHLEDLHMPTYGYLDQSMS